MAHVIVSYDGSRDDRDALALGRLLAAAGAEISLAYVRHASEPDTGQDAAVAAQSEEMLAAAARELEGVHVAQHVLLHPSTAEGLAGLAGQLGADVIAFGSSYRTPAGRVELPHTAEQLLDDEVSCSLALAPAGMHDVQARVATVCVHDEHDEHAHSTASSLARALGATVGEQGCGLLVIASRQGTPDGRLALSATAREHAEQADSPVLMLARGADLTFG
jgi:nucleotide-binding universal stress UspA family protein